MASAHYATRAYWDARFATEESYEWLADYAAVRGALVAALAPLGPAPRVLVVGNGSSSLPASLAAEPALGGARVLATDFSAAAVARARAAGVEAAEADMADLLASRAVAAGAPWDAIVDKGALDAVLADGGDAWAPRADALAASRAVLASAAAALRPGGVLVQVSFAQPAMRLQHLLQRDGRGPRAAPVPPPSPPQPPPGDAGSGDEWEPDLSPGVAPGGARPTTDCAGTPWASCDVRPVDAGLGYFAYVLVRGAP